MVGRAGCAIEPDTASIPNVVQVSLCQLIPSGTGLFAGTRDGYDSHERIEQGRQLSSKNRATESAQVFR